ncbi:MAG: hydrogenase formation protein HypD [Armatimonadetes bacterium]|nr:hydrogenase formation protein HypD [Armatimonadota bacterium]
MKFSEEFRDRALVAEICSRLAAMAPGSAAVMEVCGTHTMSAARFGLRSLLPAGVRLVSGPGCPVCVTDQRDIDAFLAMGTCDCFGCMQPKQQRAILVSFGDMLRVPGSETSLERLRGEGADVRVVYSPMDAVDIARENPGDEVVFFGIGFETTAPAVALAIKTAASDGVANFSVYCVHKTMPAALRALLSDGNLNVSGLLLPGHVTTVIGADAYDFIPRELGVPCAVAGFEPVDMLLGVESILRQIESGSPCVSNTYPRAVQNLANKRAAELLNEMFVPSDAVWRGLGMIPGSGLAISDRYGAFDARRRFAETVNAVPPASESACMCADVLRGAISPVDCAHFGNACTPIVPLGPCMVSSEGACAAAFKYGGF